MREEVIIIIISTRLLKKHLDMYLINLITIVEVGTEDIIIINEEVEVVEIQMVIMVKDKGNKNLDLNMLRKLNE